MQDKVCRTGERIQKENHPFLKEKGGHFINDDGLGRKVHTRCSWRASLLWQWSSGMETKYNALLMVSSQLSGNLSGT